MLPVLQVQVRLLQVRLVHVVVAVEVVVVRMRPTSTAGEKEMPPRGAAATRTAARPRVVPNLIVRLHQHTRTIQVTRVVICTHEQDFSGVCG